MVLRGVFILAAFANAGKVDIVVQVGDNETGAISSIPKGTSAKDITPFTVDTVVDFTTTGKDTSADGGAGITGAANTAIWNCVNGLRETGALFTAGSSGQGYEDDLSSIQSVTVTKATAEGNDDGTNIKVVYNTALQIRLGCDSLRDETGAFSKMPSDNTCLDYPSSTKSLSRASAITGAANTQFCAGHTGDVLTDGDGNGTADDPLDGPTAGTVSLASIQHVDLKENGSDALLRVGGYKLTFAYASKLAYGAGTATQGTAAYGTVTTANSFCKALANDVAVTSMYETGVGLQILQCFADVGTDDDADNSVTLAFYNNAHRMIAHTLLTDPVGKALVATAASNHIAGADGAARQANIKSVALKNAAGSGSEVTSQSKVSIECRKLVSADTDFATDAARRAEITKLLSKVTLFSDYSDAAGTVTLSFMTDEELYLALRYMALATLSSNTCGKWEPKKIWCAQCGPAGTQLSDAAPTAHTLTVSKADYSEFSTAYSTDGFGAATSVCGLVSDKMGASHKMIFCGSGESATLTKSETATVYFFKEEDAAIIESVTDDTSTDSTPSPNVIYYKTPTNLAAYYKMEWTIYLDGTETTGDSANILAGPGPIETATTACARYQAAITSKPIWCVSGATEASTMTMYFATAAHRTAGAKEVMQTAAAAPFFYVVPKSVSPGTLRTLVVTSKNLDSSTGAATAYSDATHVTTGTKSIVVEPYTGTACEAAYSSFSQGTVYCHSAKASGTDLTMMYIDMYDATANSAALNTAYRAASSISTGMRALATATTGKPGELVAKFATKGTDDLYTAEYTVAEPVDVADDAKAVASVIANTAKSACGWAWTTVADAVYCSSSTTKMTIGWLASDKRKANALSLGALAAGSSIGSAEPTAAKDKGTSAAWADSADGSATGFVKMTFQGYNTEDWSSAAGKKLNASGSACADLNAAIPSAIYCDAEASKSTTITLAWLSRADAKADLQTVRPLEMGAVTGNTSTLGALATPTEGQLFQACYTATKVTPADGADAITLTAGYAAATTRGDACLHGETAAAASVWCDQDTATKACLNWLSVAERATDANSIAQLSAGAKVASLAIASAKTKETTAEMVTIGYKAYADGKPETPGSDGTAWTAATEILGAADSACGSVGTLTKAVSCASVKPAGGVATLKWFKEQHADADENLVDAYIADARIIANQSDQMFVLDGASTTPEVLVIEYTAATTTTTNAARARRSLTAVGSAAAEGSFVIDDSWCKTLADTAKSAIFCESPKGANTMTLSYLDLALAVADVKSLEALTDYAVAMEVPTSQRMIVVFAVNTDLVANALCSAIESGGVDYASCKHAALVVGSRRRLSTADVTVTLGFATPATYAAGALAAQALVADPSALEAAGVTAVSSVTDGSGSPVGTPAPSPTSDSDDTDDSDGTSTATLRVVSLLGLVGFVLA